MQKKLQKIDVNGLWDFYYSPKKFDWTHPETLPSPDQFSGKMMVPGYWDDHYELFDEEDFFGLEARFNPDYRKAHFPMARTLCPHAASSFLIGTGFYRSVMKADFAADSLITFQLGPAMWGASLFCNRKLAGHFTGYSTASEFDITGLLIPGKENELILVVDNVNDDGGAYARLDGSHDGIPFGSRPGQHRGLAAQGYQSERGGIGGGASILITGNARICDWFLCYADGYPEFHVSLRNGHNRRLHWKIAEKERILDSGIADCREDELVFSANAWKGKLWSDRDPALYEVSLELRDSEGVLDHDSRSWGACELKCDRTQILVNGTPTYFRGITEHCYFPETANPHFNKEKYLHDLGVFRKAGFNFIRCHTQCPPEPFYDACDELGLLVQTELPSVYSWDEVKAILKMIRRHPSAVIFCEGNEKKFDDEVTERCRRLAALVKDWIPGMLFNPQEAIRGVEYEFFPDRNIVDFPLKYDAERLAELNLFSDVYGSLGGGYFSYEHDMFPGVETVEREHTIYQKPCLSHEIGILGGYLDFSLEKRYEGTFIGTDLYVAARENMQKHGVYQYADLYYKNNNLFMASCRKQLIENLRSCPSIAGYDYLGGIDTHWHLIGYPCGIFNEFYEEKYGETAEDVRRYNDESVLLCSMLNRRNFVAPGIFHETVKVSYYGSASVTEGQGLWSFETSSGRILASGEWRFGNLACGTVSEIGKVEFKIPVLNKAEACVLKVSALVGGRLLENHWDVWLYPAAEKNKKSDVLEAEHLTVEILEEVENGKCLLLTGNFPCRTRKETFRTHTSGRSLGHSGSVLHEHPVWKEFPQDGFADWQFFPMMTNCTSLIQDAEMPEFRPIFELIPSFKLIRRKSLLSEYRIGKGRILMCGLVLDEQDPASMYFHQKLLEYLAKGEFAPAPEWDKNKLLFRIAETFIEYEGGGVDEGGRPLDWRKE